MSSSPSDTRGVSKESSSKPVIDVNVSGGVRKAGALSGSANGRHEAHLPGSTPTPTPTLGWATLPAFAHSSPVNRKQAQEGTLGLPLVERCHCEAMVIDPIQHCFSGEVQVFWTRYPRLHGG